MRTAARKELSFPGSGLPANLVSEWAGRPLTEVVSLVHKVGGPLNWALFGPAAHSAVCKSQGQAEARGDWDSTWGRTRLG